MQNKVKNKNSKNSFQFESALLIKEHIQKWSEAQEGLSIRSWALLMELSSSYLSLILNSKRLVSPEALMKIVKALDLDTLSKQKLYDARDRDWLKVKNVNFNKLIENTINPSSSINAKEILDSSLLLKSWIPMALLDFSTCTGFTQNQKDLARYFGVTSETIGRLLNELEVAGFLVRDEHNQLKKTHQDIRVPTPRSSKSIRAFHIAMMKKAMETLSKPVTPEIVSKRLVNSYTVAVNEDQLPQAFDKMNSAFQSIIDDLKFGPCTTVYQVQFQIIPLLKQDD